MNKHEKSVAEGSLMVYKEQHIKNEFEIRK
jgi:hypothetical protein